MELTVEQSKIIGCTLAVDESVLSNQMLWTPFQISSKGLLTERVLLIQKKMFQDCNLHLSVLG